MLSFLKVTFLSILLTASLSASDLLLKATNGIISDNDFGIKQLSKDEMSSVKGGYTVAYGPLSSSMAIAVAFMDPIKEMGIVYDEKGNMDYDKTMAAERGLCGIGERECYLDKNKKTHSYQSKQRLLEYAQALGPNYKPATHALAYTVQRHIGVTPHGEKYAYFTYGTAAVNLSTLEASQISTGLSVDTYSIVRELRDAYKNTLESELGGYTVQ